MKWLTLDGPPGLCVMCRAPETSSAGEALADGENTWFLKTLCRACDRSLVTQGRRFIPRVYREQFLELMGQWRIRVDQAWLASELDALGVATSLTKASVGTQTELPERRMPAAPSRIDGGPAGPPVTVEDAGERLRVAGYLEQAACLVVGGYTIDPITRDPRPSFRRRHERRHVQLVARLGHAGGGAWAAARPLIPARFVPGRRRRWFGLRRRCCRSGGCGCGIGRRRSWCRRWRRSGLGSRRGRRLR